MIVIVGASGFVGNGIYKECLFQGEETILINRNNYQIISPNNKATGPHRYEKISEIKMDENIDYLIDAAWHGTSGPMRGDLNVQLDNLLIREDILQFCYKHDCKYIGCGSLMEKESYISSFDDNSHPTRSTFYTHAKYMAHAITKSLANELSVDYSWGRITNAYGPGENTPRLINNTIRKIILKEPLSFSSGKQFYDFIYISDVAKAMIAIAKKGRPNVDYLVGSGKPRKLREYLEAMNNLLCPEIKFSYGDDPDPNKLLGINEYDSSKLTKHTGFKPSVSFEEGIVETFKSYSLVD